MPAGSGLVHCRKRSFGQCPIQSNVGHGHGSCCPNFSTTCLRPVGHGCLRLAGSVCGCHSAPTCSPSCGSRAGSAGRPTPSSITGCKGARLRRWWRRWRRFRYRVGTGPVPRRWRRVWCGGWPRELHLQLRRVLGCSHFLENRSRLLWLGRRWL